MMINYIRPILKLIVFVFCTIICALPFFFLQQIPLISNLEERYVTVLVESLLIVSIFGALWMMSWLYEPSAFKHFFLRAHRMLSGIAKGALIGVGCILACVTLIAITGSVAFSVGKISLVFFLYYILYFLVVAAFEEMLFRTYPLFVFVESYPIWLAVVINGLLFGAVHATNPGFTWLGMLNISLAGILFSLFTIYYKSISWAIGIHLGWNFAQGILFGYKVSGTDTPGLLVAKPTGVYYLSGGTFGVEGSVICTLVLTTIIIYVSRNYTIKSSRNILTEENEFTGTR
jgi:membrane protease YdiL (CAAX protease family)